MINYQEIVENLETDKVIELMRQLGVEDYSENDAAVIFPTICHNEDANEASKKLYYYKDTHLFYCYTECGPISIFKFLKHYYDTRGIEYDWYKDILQVVLSCSASDAISQGPQVYRSIKSDYEPQKVRKELPTYPNGLMDAFVKRYPVEWLNDGITTAAMDKFNIKYSISYNKIIIPHYNVEGQLVGIRGRALNDWEIETFGKYMPVQIENTWYSHPLSLNLYGLNENKEEIKRRRYACIFEAEKSVLQMESFDGPHIGVASCGNKINKYQIDLLLRHCHPQEVIICFDKDQDDFDKLYKMCKAYRNYVKMSFTFDEEGLLGEKDSPTDKGEEIFNRLIEKRVKIL